MPAASEPSAEFDELAALSVYYARPSSSLRTPSRVASFQNCFSKKRMSARAGFAGARCCARESTVRVKKSQKYKKSYFEGGWCPMTKNEVKRQALAWHGSESLMLAVEPATDSH
jgi:hypothetical protein